jgi:methionine synthase I (cobalamin-dependent)
LSNPFLERIKKGPILCDGAMGTLLYSKGIPYEHCFDGQNLSNPKVILEVHQEYIRVGAEIIETNTFGANRFRLQNYGLEDKVRQINLQGAKIAREAREIEGQMVFVAGSIGPLGKPLAPLGKITPKEARSAFREQAKGLLEGGVDLFIIETMSDLVEIKEAILAVREVCQLPIVAQMTFSENGKTFMGETPQEVVSELEKLKVDVIGANCSVGPQKMLDTILAMASVSETKLSAQPNAGLPCFVNERFIYLSPPGYFAEYAHKLVQAGASIVGGCCGTTPEHIKAIFEILKQIKPEEQARPYVKLIQERKKKEQKR